MNDGDQMDPHWSDRRRPHWRVQEVAVMFMLIVQLAGLIWGAATLKSGVDQQEELLAELKGLVNGVDNRQRQQEIDMARQNGRIDAIQSMVIELQRNRR